MTGFEARLWLMRFCLRCFAKKNSSVSCIRIVPRGTRKNAPVWSGFCSVLFGTKKKTKNKTHLPTKNHRSLLECALHKLVPKAVGSFLFHDFGQKNSFSFSLRTKDLCLPRFGFKPKFYKSTWGWWFHGRKKNHNCWTEKERFSCLEFVELYTTICLIYLAVKSERKITPQQPEYRRTVRNKFQGQNFRSQIAAIQRPIP